MEEQADFNPRETTPRIMKFTTLFKTLAGSLFLATSFTAYAGGPVTDQLAGISANGKLVVFRSNDPEAATSVKIRGLQKKEKLLAIDVRPLDGQLYGLGSTSRIYTINRTTGQATAVAGPIDPLIAGESFAFDFNPVVDRIRIMSDGGQNLRVNPDTGAVVAIDAGLAYAGGDPNFATIPGIVACAYNNNDNIVETPTTLFNIDATRDILVVQNPPNAGTLNTIGALGVDVSDVAGFDISGSTGIAYAGLIVKDGNKKRLRTTLVTVNLATGATTSLGRIGGPWPLTSLTVLPNLILP
jgi:Domain of unknown function (DUF4394)